MTTDEVDVVVVVVVVSVVGSVDDLGSTARDVHAKRNNLLFPCIMQWELPNQIRV